jgi:hypothetical protein
MANGTSLGQQSAGGHPTLAALRARLMILNGRADDELMPEHLERPALRLDEPRRRLW